MKVDTGIQAEFADLGVSVQANEDEESGDIISVWRVNWPVVTLFLDLETQWRAVAGLAGIVWTGIDYTSVRAVLDIRRRRRQGRLLDDLMVMEREALEAFGEAEG